MKASKIFIWIMMVCVSVSVSNCKKDLDETGIGTFYVGTLTLQLTNVFPKFNATSTPVTVNIDADGWITFGTGTLNYDQTEQNSEQKISRQGTLTIAPHQAHQLQKDSNDVQINENTSYHEVLKMWIWKQGKWEIQLDEVLDGVWNGGLKFNLNESTVNGSVVEVVTALGSATWTLTLTPG